jgi:hypothetical protein
MRVPRPLTIHRSTRLLGGAAGTCDHACGSLCTRRGRPRSTQPPPPPARPSEWRVTEALGSTDRHVGMRVPRPLTIHRSTRLLGGAAGTCDHACGSLCTRRGRPRSTQPLRPPSPYSGATRAADWTRVPRRSMLRSDPFASMDDGTRSNTRSTSTASALCQ